MRLIIPPHVLRMSDQEFRCWAAVERQNARRDARKVAFSIVLVGAVLLLLAVYGCPHLL